MKSISAEELDQLKGHLMKKPFKYEEVYHEVLDHYATAYERSSESLGEVRVELDKDFSDNKVEDINSRYFDDLKRSLRKSHGTIFMGHFRWPQLMYTLIATIVLWVITPFLMVNSKVVYVAFACLTVTPAVVGLYLYFYWAVKRLRGKTKLKNAHAELFGVAFGFSTAYIQLPQLCKLFDEDFNVLMYDSALTTVILFLALILFQTSFTLMFNRLKPAIL
ncbi:hypothetical protein [Marinoscillum sp.]|uniref:hypothetical protein n=1 Tax=Marinoscillum sp. TaxID=2024838 RepID=UPI003BAA50CB